MDAKPKWLGLITLMIVAIFLNGCGLEAKQDESTTPIPASTHDYLDFPPTLSPQSPHDVDTQLQKQLTDAKKFDDVQRLFEVLSWQNFVALNWPTDKKGTPKPMISDAGELVWSYWKESYEVYKPDGSKPLPWGQYEYPAGFKLAANEKVKVLYRTSKFSHLEKADVDDEIDQAFTSPIWDQNGNLVRYEIVMNEVEFDYLVENQLYNIDGQIAFSKANKKVQFPSATRSKVGAVELKLAWKVIDSSKDIAERFLTQNAFIYNEDGTYSNVLVGLVGMHIALKTVSSPQWIWATFEQVDNLEANPLVEVNGKKLKPSFYDPDCAICPINVFPQLTDDYHGASSLKKNQIQRVLPIPKATQDLNQQVQSILRNNNSVLQYYQLIGTQWPTSPSTPPYPVEKHNASNPPQLPEAVTNKSGGMPTPTYLTNMVMETYFQGATLTGQGPQYYNQKIANAEAWNQIQGFKQYGENTQRIFATESCIGCHYSSSIAVGEKMVNGKRTAIYGEPLASDFSWLLQLKASFKK